MGSLQESTSCPGRSNTARLDKLFDWFCSWSTLRAWGQILSQMLVEISKYLRSWRKWLKNIKLLILHDVILREVQSTLPDHIILFQEHKRILLQSLLSDYSSIIPRYGFPISGTKWNKLQRERKNDRSINANLSCRLCLIFVFQLRVQYPSLCHPV